MSRVTTTHPSKETAHVYLQSDSDSFSLNASASEDEVEANFLSGAISALGIGGKKPRKPRIKSLVARAKKTPPPKSPNAEGTPNVRQSGVVLANRHAVNVGTNTTVTFQTSGSISRIGNTYLIKTPAPLQLSLTKSDIVGVPLPPRRRRNVTNQANDSVYGDNSLALKKTLNPELLRLRDLS